MNIEEIKLFAPGIRVYPVTFQENLYTVELRKLYGKHGAFLGLYAYIHKYVDKNNLLCRHTGKLVFKHVFEDDELEVEWLHNNSYCAKSIFLYPSALTREDLKAYAPEIISYLFQMYKSEIDKKNAKAKFMKDNIDETYAWDGIVNVK